MDLGANELDDLPRRSRCRCIAPAILSAALLGFALSIDDFVITYFVAGSTTTFPLFVWGAARVGVPPQVNVIATAIFLVAVLVMIGNVLWGSAHRASASRCRRQPCPSAPTGGRMTRPRPTCSSSPSDHLWMHFTRMGGYRDGEMPIIVRGDGCYLEDANGKRYLDALAGLFSRQHRLRLRRGDRPGGARADARAAVLHELVVRAPARDRARRRGRVARAGRPQPRLLRLRRLGGGRVGVEARAPVLPRARARSGCARAPADAGARHDDAIVARLARRPAATRRSRATSRTTGRRSARSRSTGSRRSGCRSSRSCPRCGTSATRTATTGRRPRPRRSSRSFLLDDLEQTIVAMGPETVCLVHMEPVQNAGGAFTPPVGYWQGVREICDRYDILLSADEVITGFGRIGALVRLRALRHPARTSSRCAKGLSSSYARDRRRDRDATA